MIETVRYEGEPAVPIWLDTCDPSMEELQSLARRYKLHPTLVADCLQPLHLPKHENSEDVTFLIVRAFDEQASPEATSVGELTRKVAFFLGNRFLISVHREEPRFLVPILSKYRRAPSPVYLQVALIEVLLAAVETYQAPLEEAEGQLHEYESAILTTQRDLSHWSAVFRTQARLTVIKRMLWHTLNAVQTFVPRSSTSRPLCQDLRERIESLLFFTDNLLEDLRNLLSVQLALASHEANQVMRTLTMFSVFFLPLSFVVGLYGMNFRYMPELEWHYGYAVAWSALLAIVLLVWRWFRQKHWL
jgi:magnesium transporter